MNRNHPGASRPLSYFWAGLVALACCLAPCWPGPARAGSPPPGPVADVWAADHVLIERLVEDFDFDGFAGAGARHVRGIRFGPVGLAKPAGQPSLVINPARLGFGPDLDLTFRGTVQREGKQTFIRWSDDVSFPAGKRPRFEKNEIHRIHGVIDTNVQAISPAIREPLADGQERRYTARLTL